MTDQLDSLFQEFADDVPDNGFSDTVMTRINQPVLIRRGILTLIYVLLGCLVFGPVSDLIVMLGSQLTVVNWFDESWVMRNQGIFIAALICGVISFVIPALED